MDAKEVDYYGILNVDENATFDEIKKSYRKLSMIHHPDRNPSPESTKIFQNISAAYEILSDSKKRKMYDMQKNSPLHNIMQSGNGGAGAGGMGMGDLFSQIFSNLGPMSQGFGQDQDPIRIFRMNSHDNESDTAAQFFSNFINTQNNHKQPQLQKPTPLTHTLVVSFADMFTGALLPIEIERWIIENGVKKYENEILYVDVPKGVDDNEILVVPNKGNVANDSCKGDVKVFIQLDNSDFPHINRRGIDLVFEKNITLKEALCGFSFVVKHLNGTNYTITNIGRVISAGYHKKIPKLGITREEYTGCLVILFKIQFPETLSDKIIEELKSIEF